LRKITDRPILNVINELKQKELEAYQEVDEGCKENEKQNVPIPQDLKKVKI
jgi:hypothetical protein